MPPHPPNINLPTNSLIKTLPRLLKPNEPQLPLTAKTAKTAKSPFQDLPSLLQNCKHKTHLNQIHAHMVSTGLIHNPPLASKLIASFALNPLPGTTCVAHSIADRVNGLDTYTWNTIIRGYLEAKNPKEAILVYAHVRRKGMKVDSYTLQFVSKACRFILEGEQIHCQILKMGFLSELIIVSSIIRMYGLLNKLDSAQNVFDETSHRDIVLWNVLIGMYGQRNYEQKALWIFCSMANQNVRPNEVSAVSILSAACYLRMVREGKEVHGYVIKNLASLDVFVYNALLEMYSKCGCLSSAEQIFRRMRVRNVVSWTTMINGYSSHNCLDEALALVKEMERDNVRPDEITVLGIVSLCSKLGNFELAESLDHYVEKNGLKENSICMLNALIDMHAKCGNIKKACQVFYQMEEKTIVSWTTIIQGLAMHGHGIPALTRFCQMQREGFQPDSILFLSVLSACSHAGLVEEGRKCLRSMIEDYGMTPWMEHYGCVVDLLCRAGLVREALEFVKDMHMNPDVTIWRMLLAACRNQGNISLASQIVIRLLKLEPEYRGNYILLSNLYADMGEWDNVEDLRTEMEVKGVSKQDSGYSSIEVN